MSPLGSAPHPGALLAAARLTARALDRGRLLALEALDLLACRESASGLYLIADAAPGGWFRESHAQAGSAASRMCELSVKAAPAVAGVYRRRTP